MTVPCTESHRLERIETKQDRILSILEGNGSDGLVTKVAVHRTYFKLVAAIGGPIIVFLMARLVWTWVQ